MPNRHRLLPIIAALSVFVLLGASCSFSNRNADSGTPDASSITVNMNTENANVPVIDLSTNVNSSGGTDAGGTQLSADVIITDDGFSPQTVTVRAGGTVTWTNAGATPHWPASDPHPAHTGLPGFDSLAGLASGETYQFTVTKPGTFGYHDHLFPLLKGTVIVK